MDTHYTQEHIQKLLSIIGNLVPEFMENPADRGIANGNLAVCIIDEDGNVYGKLFGHDKIRSRESFRVAWTKASQVWITGMKSGEYEKAVFNKEVDEHKYGIMRPDFIGLEGGQILYINNLTKVFAGFSGFRNFRDSEILEKANHIAKS